MGDGAALTPWRSNAWLMLVLLTLLEVMQSMDRNLLQLVAEPVKHEFHLSDGQLGILLGTAYGIPYATAGFLLAPLIDRVNRTKYLSGILALWSAATFFTGMASSYLSLLVARAAVGAAESGGNPTSLSLLADKFPPGRRATAVGLFKVGTPGGHLVATVVVALVAANYGWRSAFFLAGVPGLLLALALVTLVAEPARGELDKAPLAHAPRGDFAGLKFVFSDSAVLVFGVGMLLTVFSGSAFLAFIAPLLQRVHGFSLADVGWVLGVASLLSVFSPIATGYCADRLSRFGAHAITWFVALLMTLQVAGLLLAVMSPVAWVAIGAMLVWNFIQYGALAPTYGALMAVAPASLRGSLFAFLAATIMLVGFGGGPVIVGFASDHLGSLQHALAIVVGGSAALSALCFGYSAIRLRALRGVG